MKKLEICDYCGDNYIPKRRGVQRFCSNSCRSSDWKTKQKKNLPKVVNPPKSEVDNLSTQQEKTKREGMSWAGFGNAFSALAAFEILKNSLASSEKKMATKQDIQELKKLIETRYYEVHNIPTDRYGNKPYFDMATGSIVYYDAIQNRFITKSDFF